jgi:hypothetical protein
LLYLSNRTFHMMPNRQNCHVLNCGVRRKEWSEFGLCFEMDVNFAYFSFHHFSPAFFQVSFLIVSVILSG